MHCAVYSVHYTVCSVQYTVCSIQFAVCSILCQFVVYIFCAQCSVAKGNASPWCDDRAGCEVNYDQIGTGYCTVLYCTVLYCTVLYCTVLYCTVL